MYWWLQKSHSISEMLHRQQSILRKEYKSLDSLQGFMVTRVWRKWMWQDIWSLTGDQTEVVLLLVGMFMISASKDCGQKLIESAQHYTRICLNFLRVMELWTHWMNYTCWLCNMCIFLGSMPPYVNSQPSRITMVLEQLGHQIPLAMW